MRSDDRSVSPSDIKSPNDHQIATGRAIDLMERALADQREAYAGGDLTAPVLACPGWTVRDLAQHVTNTLCWVRGAIEEGHPNSGAPPLPASREGLIERFDEVTGALVALLRRTSPDTPCWTFGGGASVAGFWHRRMMHEQTVHALDARASVRPRPDPSVDPGPSVDPSLDPSFDPAAAVELAVAADGIDEVVDMFFPRQVRLHRIEPLTRSLAVRPDETSAVRVFAGDGASVSGSSVSGASVAPPPDATVAGPAAALYLLLWRRLTPDDPRVRLTGDHAAAREVLATALAP